MSDDLMVCRCEEVTLGDLKRALAEGATTAQALKMFTRAGMGMCQGRTCRWLIEALLLDAGLQPEGNRPPSYRVPVRPTPMAALAECSRGGRNHESPEPSRAG